MRAADVVVLGGLGVAGWLLWKRYGPKPGAGAGADVIDGVLRSVGIRTPNAIGEDAVRPVRFPVIRGEVYSHSIDARTGAAVVRIADYQGVFKPLQASVWPSAAKLASAPLALPGFPALRAAGRAWYSPWNGTGRGLAGLGRVL